MSQPPAFGRWELAAMAALTLACLALPTFIAVFHDVIKPPTPVTVDKYGAAK